MRKLFLCLSALVLWAGPAQAQTVPQYCNAVAVYDTAVLGAVRVVAAPTIGGIYLCGFVFASSATATLGVKLSFSTAGVINTSATGAPVVTGALQVPITPAFQFISPTSAQFLIDHDASYTGLFIPSGNQLNVTTTVATGPVQALVYYWTQNP